MASDFRFGSKAKMSRFAHHIFQTFYLFPSRFSHILKYVKNLDSPFSVSAKYGRISLSIWSKNMNFHFAPWSKMGEIVIEKYANSANFVKSSCHTHGPIYEIKCNHSAYSTYPTTVVKGAVSPYLTFLEIAI